METKIEKYFWLDGVTEVLRSDDDGDDDDDDFLYEDDDVEDDTNDDISSLIRIITRII